MYNQPKPHSAKPLDPRFSISLFQTNLTNITEDLSIINQSIQNMVESDMKDSSLIETVSNLQELELEN